MADQKISELNAITGANTADDDLFVIVDTSTNETKKIAKSELVSTINAALVDGAPTTLDTLNELAAALNDDANFATTVTNSLAGKVDTSGDSMTGNLSFGDNDKAIFGAGSDLQIYHDGSNSYIDEAGTGNLILRAHDRIYIKNYTTDENHLIATANGAVDLYYDNSKKLATTSTGIDVTGTATMDGLTVDGDLAINSTNNVSITQTHTDGNTVTFTQSGTGGDVEWRNANGGALIRTNGLGRLNVQSDGDISFYEDTGTTAKFFWDASAENLTLTTIKDSTSLTLSANLTTVGGGPLADYNQLLFDNNAGAGDAYIRHYANTHNDSNSALAFGTANAGVLAERMRIDSSGNVGIGMAPTGTLSIRPSGTGSEDTHFGFGANLDAYITTGSSGNVIFREGNGAGANTERMRIDSSGNVGIGTSSPSQKLHVSGSDDVYTQVQATGVNSTSGILLNNDARNWVLRVEGGDGDKFQIRDASAGQQRMTIDSSGNVGIGTSSPSSQLHIDGATNGTLRVDTTASGYLDLSMYSNGGFVGTSAWQPLRFGTNNIERMRIDSSGNVGIGTSSPVGKLDISAASGTEAVLSLTSSGIQRHQIIQKGSGDGALSFYNQTAAAERMRIDSSGNLLVGANSYSIGSTGFKIAPSGFARIERSGTTSQFHMAFTNGNGDIGSISTSGSATAYNTSSDYRLKEDWQPVANASDRVAQLKPVNFAWKADGKRVDGFLAHELAEVIPEAVTGEKDAMRTEEYEVSPAVYEDVVIPAVAEELDADGNVIVEAQPERTEQVLVSEAVMGTREVPDYQGIDQSKLVPLLTAALQEALTEIDNLKQRVSALETN